jgi:ATPase subunit of ABC transporter with duplicated ATPase domains
MISFSNINKQYGKQLLFVDASFQLNPGEKVGLVGPNGSGKTTLFRMVVGEETPDEGAVSVPKKLTIWDNAGTDGAFPTLYELY